jgi:molybdate transport system substrate-binding protein
VRPEGLRARATGGLPRRLAIALLCFVFPNAARADEVLVFAAASLTDALKEVALAFEADRGHKVSFSFAGSNDLARQIKAGAQADVFFSADAARMDDIQRAGLVRPEDRVDVLGNRLVVVVPVEASSSIKTVTDLAGVERLALANPEAVPAGIYAKGWLEAAGLWAAVAPKVVPTLDVRAALAAVESGNVTAGVVYRTDARISKRVRVALEVPKDQTPRIVYPLARLWSSTKPGASAFVSWLVSERGLAVFERHGFEVVKAR